MRGGWSDPTMKNKKKRCKSSKGTIQKKKKKKKKKSCECTLVPALDHVADTDLGLEGLAAVNGGVELGAVALEL